MIDIIGVGDRTVSEPKVKMQTLEDYILIARKSISSIAPTLNYGIADEMLNDDDVVSNIAHAIMMADWQFNGEGNIYGFRKSRARFAIKSYLTRRAKERNSNVYSLDRVMRSEDSEATFAELISDKSVDPRMLIEEFEYNNFMMDKLDALASKGTLSEKGYRLVKERYLEGKSIPALAEQEGVTRQAIHNLISRTLKSIKNCLKAELI